MGLFAVPFFVVVNTDNLLTGSEKIAVPLGFVFLSSLVKMYASALSFPRLAQARRCPRLPG
jgi:hypothetical protein